MKDYSKLLTVIFGKFYFDKIVLSADVGNSH